ncbi:MAG: DHHA1 domain-containing protein [Candidatus Thermoplasmatota archaeon]
MYVIYSTDDDLHRFQNMVRSRGKKAVVYRSDEKGKEDLLNFIEDRYRDIDSLIYLEIKKDELSNLSKKVEKINQDIYQLAVLEDGKKDEKLATYIDDIVKKSEWIETHLFKKLEEHFSTRKNRELKKAISSTHGNISIFMHDDPDLDAIASAMALEEICEVESVEAETYFAGSFGHPETELFMKNADFVIGNIDDDSVEDVLGNTRKIAFVDFAEASMSDTIPDYVEPDLIIDHHQTNKDVRAKEYTEIRSDVGATSTLMTNHLLNMDIEIPSILASALLVGIKVDTKDYTRNISASDYKILSYLNAVADKDILDVLENTPIYSETVSAMGRAISNREFKDSVITTFCGDIDHRDDIAQIANFLLRERDILNVLVYGIKDDKIHMSARSKDLQLNVGKIMEDAYSEIGEAGGHPHAGGGEVPLDEFTDIDEAVEKIKKRFHYEVFER